MSSVEPRHIPSATPSWRWLTGLIWWIEHAFERAKADQRPEEDTRVRIALMLIVFSVLFIALVGGAGHAALLSGDPGAGGWRAGPVLARGDLTDRNGNLLAANIRHYGLYVEPAEVWDRETALEAMSAALPRLPHDRLREALYGDRRVVVMNGLTPPERAALHDLALGGVYFEAENARVYPLGGSAAHVIGFAGERGVTGAELAFDREIRRAGATGEAVPLSIDLRVQAALENELYAAAAEMGARGAVGVITNIQTGEVLAMASYPNFDPNRRGETGDAELNRVTSAHYEMGSVFKAFTVAAGLDTGQADMTTTFDASDPLQIGNRTIRDFHAQNRVMTLEDVFLHSSNIGTSRLAIEMGGDTMQRYFQDLGLLDAAPIELHESAAPRRPVNWRDTTLASLSFGYGIMVTPAQAAAAMGSLLNGGRYVPLTLRPADGPHPGLRRVVSEDTSREMLALMRANVVRGSGSRADAPGLRVGGKTGSANKVVNGRYDPTVAIGTFAAVFPTDGPLDAPRYMVFILMDEPQGYPRTGGFVAAPVAGRVIDRIAGFLNVGRGADRWRTATGAPIPQPEDRAGAAQ
ncbi:penicillin-binding protein 2 [Brevundimonas sp. BAL450]|uniref:Cell division protein FtsI [Peptidoglycan synthetase] n=1 Tax=Brevundimonas abyssalis TAR-001 TaxID=1391729 RepID=A0A8E0KLA7_9CAUL|nr:penicillin-binding protein 2 [Brevundimonas abyssalis]MBG7614154.1 penicillin-binding protein 2 [Brevundimonas sp. BAL450]GAD58915.1 cell division protein FtsI [Peptidoglycan synthetase] [Brevundimonas abyssalis TAR-001]